MMIEHPYKTPGDPPDPNDKPHKDYWLDMAIADSMVASDPVAAVSKGEPTSPPRWPYEGEEKPVVDDEPKAEQELDEAIADSMVASDPVAVVSKGEPTAPPRRPRPEGEAPKPAHKPGQPAQD
jgi:hypothetical protein